VRANASGKIVVVGVGNELLKDEGVGVHVARALQELSPPGGVEMEVIDGGTLPDVILSFGDAGKLIIVDAVKTGAVPGSVYRFRSGDLTLENKALTSIHEVSLLENLWLMEKFSRSPEDVVIIGIEPEDMSWGLELSAKLQQKIPHIIKLVLEEASSEYAYKLEKGGQEL